MWQGCSQILVKKLANYGWISKFKLSMEASWGNHVKIYKIPNIKKKCVKFFKISFANFRHYFGLSRGKIWLWLYIRLYFGAGRGGGWGRGRGRVGGGGGGGGVVGTCWLFKGHGSTDVTWAMTAYKGPPTARQFWQLWQLTWAVTAYIGRPTAGQLWQPWQVTWAVTAYIGHPTAAKLWKL